MSARDVFLRVAVISLCIAPALPASAQSLSKFYVRADAGWSRSVDGNFQDVDFLTDHVITGYGRDKGRPEGLTAAHGCWEAESACSYSPRFRGDIVYTYRGTYRLDEFDQAPLPNNFRGHVTSNSVMLTGYADFPILDSGGHTFPRRGRRLGEQRTGQSVLATHIDRKHHSGTTRCARRNDGQLCLASAGGHQLPAVERVGYRLQLSVF
jgi:hypothetical protein